MQSHAVGQEKSAVTDRAYNSWCFACIPISVGEGARMHNFWGLLSETFNHWLENKAQRLGAALAYYAAFSFAPLLVLLVTVANFIYKEDTLARVQSEIALMAGNNAAEAIVATIRGVQNTGGGVVA